MEVLNGATVESKRFMHSRKTRPKYLPEPVYHSIFSKVRRLTVDLVIRKGTGIVMVKRDIPPCRDYWIIPGGTVLLGETLEETACRVARDETGLTVGVAERLGVLEYSRRTSFGQAVAIVYSAVPSSGTLKGNKYGKEVRVFSRLPSRMVGEQRRFLARLGFRPLGRRFPEGQ